MKFTNKYRLLLYKSYLDTGISLTNYMKGLIAIFGIYSLQSEIDLRITFLIAFLYGIGCFFLGWAYFHYKWIYAANEVNNRYNLFVKEMRRKRFK